MTDTFLNPLLQSLNVRWVGTEGKAETRLLRLALLRELLFKLHFEKSRSLAHRNSEEAHSIENRENALEALRSHPSLGGNLMDLLQNSPPLNSSPSLDPSQLPQRLLAVIDSGKFLRGDRLWELEILKEALQQQWQLWSLQAWVKIDTIAAFDAELGRLLWDSGILLFSENASSDFQANLNPQASSPSWHGCWYIVMTAQTRSAPNLTTSLASFLGEAPTSENVSRIDRLQWNRIYG